MLIQMLDRDRLRCAAVLGLEGAAAFPGKVIDIQNGYVNYAEYAPVAGNQRDIDGEFTVALDEFPGAVERVDQPVGVPQLALLERQCRRLLRQHRDVGCKLGQRRDDGVVGCHVRVGQRRFVVLVFDVKTGFVNLENFFAGLARYRDAVPAQCIEVRRFSHLAIPV